MQTQYIPKPWGHELIFAHTERYVGKILHIKKDQALSLQFHHQKDETIHVHRGKIKLLTAENQTTPLQELVMNPGESFHITPKLIHRMIALEDSDLLEVSTPELDDVVRLEDRYGRQD